MPRNEELIRDTRLLILVKVVRAALSIAQEAPKLKGAYIERARTRLEEYKTKNAEAIQDNHHYADVIRVLEENLATEEQSRSMN